MRYWIGVVSKEHVLKGVAGGFAQLCHGKKGSLARMKQGDILIYYSPKISMSGTEKHQKFTAVGQMPDENIYPVEMHGETFFRRDVHYFPCKETSILPLLDELSFTKNVKNWGGPFRLGHFEITKEDFLFIGEKMELQDLPVFRK